MAKQQEKQAEKQTEKKLDKRELALKELEGVLGSEFRKYATTKDYVSIPIDKVTTLMDTVDEVMDGGVPIGRIIEVYGPESCGKTYLSLKICHAFQKAGHKCLFYDVENAFNPNFASKIVDLDHFDENGMRTFMVKPIDEEEFAEKILQGILDIMQNCSALGIKLIVIDSLAALIPEAELEGSLEDQQVGALARCMSKALRKMSNYAKNNQVSVIFINQEREKPGGGGGFSRGPQTVQPGGRALKFYASMRLACKIGECMKSATPRFFEGDSRIGHPIIITCKKNKCGMPHRTGEVDIYYRPISPYYQLLKDNYGLGTLINRKGNNAKKFEYTDSNETVLSGLIDEKGDWEGLLTWFRENGVLLDFLKKAKSLDDVTINHLFHDEKIGQEEMDEYEEYKKTGKLKINYEKRSDPKKEVAPPKKQKRDLSHKKVDEIVANVKDEDVMELAEGEDVPEE